MKHEINNIKEKLRHIRLLIKIYDVEVFLGLMIFIALIGFVILVHFQVL